MPEFRRLKDDPNRPPMKTVSVHVDDQTRAMLCVIMEYEDRSTESDTLRLLIRRAYRALPPAAQTVDTATH
jgi:hypothetical protein